MKIEFPEWLILGGKFLLFDDEEKKYYIAKVEVIDEERKQFTYYDYDI